MSEIISLSPSSLNLYFECPLCFWLEKNKGVKRPNPYPYALNSTVDMLLKTEFDKYRAKGESHPLLVQNNVPGHLFPNQKLIDEWRDNQRGLRYCDDKLSATLFGAIDDVLELGDGKIVPLDYKTTGNSVPRVYDHFQLQMDTYTYLLEKLGYSTPRKGCLVFYVVDQENGFADRLPFKKELHVIDTDPSYLEKVFTEAVRTLRKNPPSSHSPDCEFGKWLSQASAL